MCIVLVTRTKRYSILLSNRDEFVARPTIPASWWPSPHDNVFGGRDLARPAHGTWLGITRQGRLVVLTNYREETEEVATAAAISRGEITREFLVSEKPVDEWVQEVLETGVYKNVGGFTIMCTILRKTGKCGYAVISNRSSVETGAHYVLTKEDDLLGYECTGLSNALIHDEWPKVKLGKALLTALAKENINDEDAFIEKCFDLLRYPEPAFGIQPGLTARTDSFTETPTIETLRDSIFIPLFATPAVHQIPADHHSASPEWAANDHPRWYATREQTVILLSHDDGRVVFTERTLFDTKGQPIDKEQGQVREEFYIEGWNDAE